MGGTLSDNSKSTSFGLEPRYLRERRRHDGASADADAAPVEQPPPEAAHTIDEITPELRHRVADAEARPASPIPLGIKLLVVAAIAALLVVSVDLRAFADYVRSLF